MKCNCHSTTVRAAQHDVYCHVPFKKETKSKNSVHMKVIEP